MLVIHEASMKIYDKIMDVMPSAIKECEREIDTVSITFKPSVDIDTDLMLRYITLKHCNKFIHINLDDLHYITIS